jgi:DNA-binding NtrC family response regulator
MSLTQSSPKHPEEIFPKVVVLEDDQPTSQLLCLILKKAGFSPLPCATAHQANELLKDGSRISAMLIDLSLPDGDGIEVMRSGRKIHKDLPCFVLTAQNAVASVVQAMKAGAENYLIKPFEPEKLVSALNVAISAYHGTQQAWSENFVAPQGVRRWKSPKMCKAIEIAGHAAKVASPVMLAGPPYSGKRSFAQLIHKGGKLKDKPMSTINLAGLSPFQIEMELFGVPLEKLQEAPHFSSGKMDKCRGATLYIENIDRLHRAAQSHLLSVIQDEHLAPKGKPPPCRIISSTSLNLLTDIKEGRFRQDLWYALSVYQIQIPSLAERLDDIPLLCENMITRICVMRKLRRPSLTRRALERLLDHSWPGNLDELYNCLEHAVSRTSDGLIGPEDFPLLHRQPEGIVHAMLPAGASSIEDLTRMSLIAALDTCGGNRRRAAQRLKISLRTIYNMIERYDLPKKQKKNLAQDSGES